MRQKLLATAWTLETSSGLDLSAPYDHGVFYEMRRDNGLNVVYPDPTLPRYLLQTGMRRRGG